METIRDIEDLIGGYKAIIEKSEDKRVKQIYSYIISDLLRLEEKYYERMSEEV